MFCHWKEELKFVKPPLTLTRAQCNQGNIDNFFKELNKILDDHHLKTPHERIFIVDESGFSTEHSPRRIVCDSNLKAQSITPSRSKTATVIGGGNAVGNFIAPYCVLGARGISYKVSEGVASVQGSSRG